MNTYPADEQRISEVERGRSCEAIVALHPGESLKAGESVLFALSLSRPGQPPSYVKGGDSVVVSLTDVTDLGTTDPGTGGTFVRLRWKPPGQASPAANAPRSVGKASRAPGRASSA